MSESHTTEARELALQCAFRLRYEFPGSLAMVPEELIANVLQKDIWPILNLPALLAAMDELKKEREKGQEVHEYLCSVNPDNLYNSVLESCIQQRGIENNLRAFNKTLENDRDRLTQELAQVRTHNALLRAVAEAGETLWAKDVNAPQEKMQHLRDYQITLTAARDGGALDGDKQ